MKYNKKWGDKMEKYVDFHSHSKYSDGKLTVSQLISKAIENNVNYFSITDHDSIQSTNDIKEYKVNKQINLINGIELSTYINFNNREVLLHLLCYDFDNTSEKLQNEIKRYKHILLINNQQFIKKITTSIKVIPECIFRDYDYYSYRLPTTQIYEILSANCYDKEFIETFINRIKVYIPAYEEYELNIKTAIELINDIGGISILAHPNQIKMDESEKDKMIIDLKRLGLMGIETYHSSFIKSDFERYRLLALKNNLLQSVGSDYHYDTICDNIIIGHGINNNLCQTNCSLKEYILKRRKNND